MVLWIFIIAISLVHHLPPIPLIYVCWRGKDIEAANVCYIGLEDRIERESERTSVTDCELAHESLYMSFEMT